MPQRARVDPAYGRGGGCRHDRRPAPGARVGPAGRAGEGWAPTAPQRLPAPGTGAPPERRAAGRPRGGQRAPQAPLRAPPRPPPRLAGQTLAPSGSKKIHLRLLNTRPRGLAHGRSLLRKVQGQARDAKAKADKAQERARRRKGRLQRVQHEPLPHGQDGLSAARALIGAQAPFLKLIYPWPRAPACQGPSTRGCSSA